MLVFEDETTITQKHCIRKSMSFEKSNHKSRSISRDSLLSGVFFSKVIDLIIEYWSQEMAAPANIASYCKIVGGVRINA